MQFKLSFSLLALKNLKDLEKLLKILKDEEIHFIELPPSKFFKGYNFSKKKIIKFKSILDKYKIKISSVQAIFFEKNFNIFNKNHETKILNHLRKIIYFCGKLSIKNIIFGSPANRQKKALKIETANDIFIRILKKITKDLKRENINFCIEPNARFYNCDYINNSEQALDIIKNNKLQNIFINYDTGNAVLENDLIKIQKENLRYFKNFQISEKKLTELSTNLMKHIKLLKNHKLDRKYLSLEMLNVDIKKIKKNIKIFKTIANKI
jgi:sugar phosphate isomerase/epimerase